MTLKTLLTSINILFAYLGALTQQSSICLGMSSKTEYQVSPEQKSFFDQNGYLIVRNILSQDEVINLQRWSQEVHDLPRTAETPWMPYEEINASGKRVLCRTENYANYHPKFNSLLRGSKLLSILGQLAGEDMLLFKEKSLPFSENMLDFS